MKDLINHGYKAFSEGSYALAAQIAARILRLDPREPAGILLAARASRMLGEPDIAAETLAKLRAAYPAVKSLRIDLAMSLRDLGHVSSALEALRDAQSVQEYLLRGEIRLSINDVANARADFIRSIEIQPLSVDAYRGLAMCGELAEESEYYHQLKSIFYQSKTSIKDRYKILYTLASLSKRSKRQEKFLRYLQQANELQRSLLSGKRDDYQQVFDNSLKAAREITSLPPLKNIARGGPMPIFVLGMPRSGTSLMETILASSSRVSPGGEINFFNRSLAARLTRHSPRRFPLSFMDAQESDRSEFAARYIRLLDAMSLGRDFVTDKTPGNFQIIGILKHLFPSAKIIHMRRNPMDTCFSVLQYPFDGNVPHTCDMQLLGYYYGQYRIIMDYWRQSISNQILEVDYEDLVTNPAEVINRVYGFLGLALSPQPIVSGTRAMPMRTFSVQQVRQPIYRSSVGASTEFSRFLAPLQASLSDSGVVSLG